MNDILSSDDIHYMLKFVKIAGWSETEISFLGYLRSCPNCFLKDECEDNGTCNHLHFDELNGIKTLMLVCESWKEIIEFYFNFENYRV